MFKQGDFVVCNNNAGYEDVLTINQKYEVLGTTRNGTYVAVNAKGSPHGGFSASRFALLTNTPRQDARAELEARAGGSMTTVLPPKQLQPVLGTQVGGDHYTRQKIQPIEYIWANNLGFSEGNIVKYVTRWKYKGGIKDLKKMVHHGNLLIEEAERSEREDGVKYGVQG